VSDPAEDGPSAGIAAQWLPPHVSRDLRLDPGHLRTVQEGMCKVVNEQGGTAYSVFHSPQAERLNVVVCGKTGTAEAEPHRVNGQVVHEGDMAWFAGFAPYPDPKIAFAVVVEYIEPGGSGSHTAAPIARELVRICQAMGYLN
jgi:penicillin-binding protein 2